MASSSSPSSDYDLEKRSLNSINKKQSSYGSLRKSDNKTSINQQQQQIVNIKHKLCNGETLQGISLKYGVTIENIKKANKLWTNDIAFIKEYLIVPINKDKYLNEFKSDPNVKLLNNNEEQDHLNNNNVNANQPDSSSSSSASSSSYNPNGTNDFKDYLNKYDKLINESKTKLNYLENNVQTTHNLNETSDSETSIFRANAKRSSSSSLSSNNSKTITTTNNNNEFDDLFKTPEFIIKQSSSNTNVVNNGIGGGGTVNNHSNSHRAKQAYENLKRLEKEKDDLYEL